MIRRMNKARMVRMLAAILLLPSLGFGAEGTDAPPQQEAQKETPKKNAPDNQVGKNKSARKDAKSGAKKGEIFVPTEEISEDYSVSFPVDI